MPQLPPHHPPSYYPYPDPYNPYSSNNPTMQPGYPPYYYPQYPGQFNAPVINPYNNQGLKQTNNYGYSK